MTGRTAASTHSFGAGLGQDSKNLQLQQEQKGKEPGFHRPTLPETAAIMRRKP
jgi:hypothetical protein